MISRMKSITFEEWATGPREETKAGETVLAEKNLIRPWRWHACLSLQSSGTSTVTAVGRSYDYDHTSLLESFIIQDSPLCISPRRRRP